MKPGTGGQVEGLKSVSDNLFTDDKLWRPPRVTHLLTWPSTDLRSTAFHIDIIKSYLTCQLSPSSKTFASCGSFSQLTSAFSLLKCQTQLLTNVTLEKSPFMKHFTVSMHVTYTVRCKPQLAIQYPNILLLYSSPFTPLFIHILRYSRNFFQSYLGPIILYFSYHSFFYTTLDGLRAHPLVYINLCRGRPLQLPGHHRHPLFPSCAYAP